MYTIQALVMTSACGFWGPVGNSAFVGAGTEGVQLILPDKTSLKEC